MQRNKGGLDRKDKDQQDSRHTDTRGLLRADHRHALGEVGHIERPGLGIERAQCKQEQGRADQVEEHILHTCPQPLGPAGMDHQAI